MKIAAAECSRHVPKSFASKKNSIKLADHSSFLYFDFITIL
jgi:hypothetical protein